jgi:uncharacterized short protein YbdD (DUF466 family)
MALAVTINVQALTYEKDANVSSSRIYQIANNFKEHLDQIARKFNLLVGIIQNYEVLFSPTSDGCKHMTLEEFHAYCNLPKIR